MSVEVHIHFESALLMLLEYRLLRRMDRWHDMRLRVFVVTIQIQPECVEAPIAASDAIGIKERDNFEDVILKQQFALIVIKRRQLVYQSLQHIRGGRLSAMHPTSEEDSRLIGECCLFAERQYWNITAFQTFGQLFFFKINLGTRFIGFNYFRIYLFNGQ